MANLTAEQYDTLQEMLKVITEARQISERLRESWAKGLANPIGPHTTHLSSLITPMTPSPSPQSQIFMIECEDDKEEAHQIQETVMIPEKTADSVSDVLLVHRMDSHVKEVEESSQKSTSGSGKEIAHQLFDKMPLAVTSKEKQRKSLKAWKFKFKISFKRSKLMDDMFSFVEETAWLNRDPKETIWDCVKKEFKETMAACGKKTIDRLKLVDETSKPAVYDGPIQIRVWESGGSPLERVDEKSSGGVKFHLKHKWRSRVLQTLSGWEFCLLPAKFDLRDWPKEESKPHQKKSHQIETFEVLSSLEPSRRSHNEQLGVSDNFPFAIVRTHISQSQSDLKCVTGNAHRMFDVMPLETKPLKNKRKKALQKTWWFKFKTSLERSKLMDAKLSFMEELGAQQGFNMEVWSGFDLEACIGFVTYGWEYKKQINIGHVSLNGMCNELVYDEEKKKLRNVKPAGCLCDLDQVNSLDEEECVGFTEFSKLRSSRDYLLMNFGIFMNPQPRHDKRITRALLVGLVGNEERLSNRLSLANYVWKPGELLCVQGQWDWISEVHSSGGVLKITQRLRGMRLQGFTNMDKKLEKVLLDDVLRAMVCWSVHNRMCEVEMKIYISANQNSRNQELLITYRFLMIGKFSRSKRLNETCCFLLEVYFEEFVGFNAHENETQSTNQSHGMEGSKRDIQGLENGYKIIVLKLKLPLSSGADWKQLFKWVGIHFSDNQRQEGLLSFPWELMLANLKENHACGVDTRCLEPDRYEFIWWVSRTCEADHISSETFSVGAFHGFFTGSKLQTGDETQEKRLLFLNNNNKVDPTVKENWFYNEPMIRGVFHLQRPPELFDLHGNLGFITKVLVQWKEHPPYQLFSGFCRQVLMLSSLRTRMF